MLPYIDEHALEIAIPRERAWRALMAYAQERLLTDGGPFHRLLGTDPPGGFEVDTAAPPDRLELTGRHRFSRYVLAFELDDAGPGATRLSARSFAEFPGLHGRAYRALVIGTRVHVVATRGMLRAVRRRALQTP